MKLLLSTLRSSALLLLLMTVLLGAAYPLLVYGAAQVALPGKANGALIEKDGNVVGSKLIGQQFTKPGYFWGRLSATSPAYNAAASGGSNLSPANPILLEAANQRLAALQKADPANKTRVPVELITASASGLDPHISIAAAEYQIPRVAKARGMTTEAVAALIQEYREDKWLGPFGHVRVNVLRLNMALDAQNK